MRGEIWMHVSGGFDLLKRSPNLYKSLLNTQNDIDTGKLRSEIKQTPFNFTFHTFVYGKIRAHCLNISGESATERGVK